MKSCKADEALLVMKSWIGKSRAKGTHKDIIDLYNSHKPLARGYKVSYTDSYCATTISAAYIKLDAVDAIGETECSVEKFIAIFKKYGIWNEDGTIIPNPGDLICYNWDQNVQPNDGCADHIGMVESVNNGYITVIEGNYNGDVKRRTIKVGDGVIRGYATPKYDTGEEKVEEKVEEKPVAKAVVAKTCYGVNDIIKPIAYVTSIKESPVLGELKVSLPQGIPNLTIRQKPDFKVRDTWYKTEHGYVSAYRVTGFVSNDKGSWYEMYDHAYPVNTVRKLQNGKTYAFDKEGYIVTPDKLNNDGSFK